MFPQFNFPVNVRFGEGVASQIGQTVGDRRVALVLSPHLEPTIADLKSHIGCPGAAVSYAPATNPSLADIQQLLPAWSVLAPSIDVIVAIGGGSAIDFAKVMAISGGDIDLLIDQLSGGSSTAASSTSIIAVPTTAGTGSEVTPWATIWDPTKQTKYSLHDSRCWAEAAFVDPDLLESCPHAVALASGLDALSHALESIWNHNANPVSDALAVQAAHGLIDALPTWLQTRDVTSRNIVSRSALLAGIAFSQTKTALAHALSYDITMRLGVPHGIACSFSLPEVWRRAVAASPERMQAVFPLFGTLSHQPLANFLSALGVDTDFSHYGIHDVEAAIRVQLGSVRGGNFIGADTHA